MQADFLVDPDDADELAMNQSIASIISIVQQQIASASQPHELW